MFALGIVASGLWGPVFGQVLLSFPTGRLPTRARRRVVAAAYGLIPLAPVPALLVGDVDQVIVDCRGECPRNVLLIARDDGLPDAAIAWARRCRSSLPRGGRDARPPVARGRRAGAPEPWSHFVGGGVRSGSSPPTRPVRSTPCCGWRSRPSPPRRSLSSRAWRGRISPARAACARSWRSSGRRPSARTCATPWRARSATPRSSSRSGCRSSTATSMREARPPTSPARDDPRRTVTEIDHHGEVTSPPSCTTARRMPTPSAPPGRPPP